MLVALAAVFAFALFQVHRAARAGVAGKGALLRAEQAFEQGRLDLARNSLAAARSDFGRMDEEFQRLGPLLWVARVTPFVRIQVRGVENLAEAGQAVAEAGTELADAAGGVLEPGDEALPLGSALEALRDIHVVLGPAVDDLEAAVDQVAALDGYRLLGPLDDARRELSIRLPDLAARAAEAEDGTGALIAVMGGDGPRRYLLLSQNPAEVRPTGGFIGTYGVMATDGQRLRLERYEPMDTWLRDHPDAVVPPEEAGSPFRFYAASPEPVNQSLANVNNVPHWPQAAQLATELWEQGGEEPVDGVFTVTPAFLAEVLGVLGPVEVPGYGETVTADNVIERFDFHTELVEQGQESNVERKAFVAALAEVVVGRLLEAPASQWRPLAQAVATSLDAREAMAWVEDAEVGQTLARQGWDGALPDVVGDFFYGAEFEYVAKNGRDLRRTYDHDVQLDADGTARITTTVTIRNTGDPGRFNRSSLSYLSIYGPQGAVVDENTGDPHIPEPEIAGHPAAGWFRQAPPGAETSATVTWEAPAIARRLDDGTWSYSLTWMRVPDHSGDVLNLAVQPPEGWEWEGPAPPERVELTEDLVGAWTLRSP